MEEIRQAQRALSGERTAATTTGREAKLLAVDDQTLNLTLLSRILRRAGYEHVDTTNHPVAAVERCLNDPPDLLLLDMRMPILDGFDVLDALKDLRAGDGHFPVLVLTGDSSGDTRRLALAAGADDFLGKPVDPLEALLRVRNLIAMHQLRQSLKHDNARLEHLVQERTADLEVARAEVLQRLALASEYRDDDTHEHALRIGRLSRKVAEAAGTASTQGALMERAASLHDIGKVAIPDAILLKPGPLDRDEFAAMQAHTTYGAEILSGSVSPLLQLAEQIALCHHERWDGSGYPSGLAGEAIPREARVVSLVDVYDALTHRRTYKPAWTHADAMAEIRRGSGSQFDPELLDVFVGVVGGALLFRDRDVQNGRSET